MSDFRNEFAWSKSKSKLFSDCKRQYWFSSYGKWNGWELRADRRSKELYLLGKLKSRPMWAADVVHRSITSILRFFRDGNPCDPLTILNELPRLMRSELDASRQGLYKLSGGHKLCALREHEYGDPLEEKEWERVIAGAEACLRNFIDSPIFENLKSIPGKTWLNLDDGFPAFLLDGVKVSLKIDAAHRTKGGGVRFFNWKSGRSEDDLAPLKLSVFALYATKVWAAPLQEIAVSVCHLRESPVTVQEMTLSPQELREAEEYIRTDVREMGKLLQSSLHENIADEADYPVTDTPRNCRACNFLKACSDSPLNGKS